MSLSAVKSVFMLIYNKIVDGSDLYLSINGTCIHPSPDTQFLGFTVDSRLKWSLHVERKIAAAKKAFFSLRSYLRATYVGL
jgi:hypothetical protein